MKGSQTFHILHIFSFILVLQFVAVETTTLWLFTALVVKSKIYSMQNVIYGIYFHHYVFIHWLFGCNLNVISPFVWGGSYSLLSNKAADAPLNSSADLQSIFITLVESQAAIKVRRVALLSLQPWIGFNCVYVRARFESEKIHRSTEKQIWKERKSNPSVW